jgi:hypothetical protein
MKSVVLGSAVALVFATGVFVSQVEAKTENHNDHGKKFGFVAKLDKHKDNGKHFGVVREYDRHHNNKSVPIPGTELLLGGGLAGLIAWRARQRKPQD